MIHWIEEKTNTPFAAMMIYKASGYSINPSKFYDSETVALDDMKRLSENNKRG